MKTTYKPERFDMAAIQDILDRKSCVLPLRLHLISGDEELRPVVDNIELSLDLYGGIPSRVKMRQLCISHGNEGTLEIEFLISPNTIEPFLYRKLMRARNPSDLVGCAHLSFRINYGASSITRYFSFEPEGGRCIGRLDWREQPETNPTLFHSD